MKCPFCGHLGDKVVDSRESRNGDSTRRRRECLSCGRRFTSYERIEEIPLVVVKKDGRREVFDRGKILAGLMRACEKRPVSRSDLERFVEDVESWMQENSDREIPTAEIGEKVMQRLHGLDKVAYVRFASVYREFKDVNEFLREISEIFESRA